MQIKINQADIARVESAMEGIRKGTPRVLTQAINATGKTMMTQARMRLGNELNLKASRISKDLSFKKASFGHLSGQLIAKGRPVGLVSYGAKRYGGGRRGKGISVKTWKRKKPYKFKHAFITTGKRGQAHGSDGNKHVFWREMENGKRVKRYPLRQLHGPRIEDAYANKIVYEPVETQAAHLLSKNIDKGIADVIRRFG